MYYSKHLSAEAYGVYQSFWIQLATLMAVATIGFPVFILTYAPTRVLGILQKINSRQWLSYTLLLLILSASFTLLQTRSSALSFIYPLSFFVVFAIVMISDALLTALRSFKAVIAGNLLYAIAFYSIHRWIVQHTYSLEDIIRMLLLLSLARILFNFIAIRIACNKIHAENISQDDWAKMSKLWWQLGWNDIIQVLFRWIDKFILSLLLAKELFAIYVNATIEIAFLPLIFSAVSSAAVQHWARQQNSTDSKDQVLLLQYSSRILSSIVFPLFFFLVFFRAEFLSSIFSEKYLDGVYIFLCAQLVLPVRAYPFTALLQSHHRGDIINKGALIDFIIACALMYPLYLLFGLPGIALSFVISTYWQAAYYLIHGARLLQVAPLQLIPSGHLMRKFFGYAILFGAVYFILSKSFSDTKSIFWIGLALLFISGASSLLYEWNKNKKNHELTSQ